jgi:hypothetical protein
MMLPIAVIVVLVLLAVALLPTKQREPAGRLFEPPPPARSVSLREQQLREESDAIATEYRRRADEVWLGEVREKAALLLGSK